jgi:hypothetical protein
LLLVDSLRTSQRELEEIQFLLGRRSVETTESYLGSRQRLVPAPRRSRISDVRGVLLKDRNTKSGSELQNATPNYLPYVDNRIVSHDVQVVMQIYRWIAVGRYECDNAAKRQAISRSWKRETTMLISEK